MFGRIAQESHLVSLPARDWTVSACGKACPRIVASDWLIPGWYGDRLQGRTHVVVYAHGCCYGDPDTRTRCCSGPHGDPWTTECRVCAASGAFCRRSSAPLLQYGWQCPAHSLSCPCACRGNHSTDSSPKTNEKNQHLPQSLGVVGGGGWWGGQKRHKWWDIN